MSIYAQLLSTKLTGSPFADFKASNECIRLVVSLAKFFRETIMKGKLKDSVKKWWVLVLVATLALSLTSCGKKRNRLMSGAIDCSGPLGNNTQDSVFYVLLEPQNNGQYGIWVLPEAVYVDEVYFSLTNGPQDIPLGPFSFNREDIYDEFYPIGSVSKSTLDQGFIDLAIDDLSTNTGILCELPVPVGSSRY